MALPQRSLRAIVDRAHPLDPAALVGQQFLGVDLSLPPFVNRLLWKTFRKCFVHDDGGDVRGWNLRMEQTGIDGPQRPLLDRSGEARTFAHYRLRDARGRRFPGGWAGAHFLDYGVPGNPFGEDLGYTPLVAVNEGDSELLLGWEVFKLGPTFLPLPDFWALRRQGPVDEVVPGRG
jgi:hypothetical protein